MTDAAAGMRRVRPLRRPKFVRRPSCVASRTVAATLTATALTLLLTALPDLLSGRLPEVLPFAATAAAAFGIAAVLAAGLAAQVAAPIADLAAAVEAGSGRDCARSGAARLPDLTRRADEIGRLARALEGLNAALSDRIAANEEFAADVAHEIRNPLASLKSAAEAMRRADAEQRGSLIEIIEHDVVRLDRLVGEISSASRLDAELVREEADRFDLLVTIRELVAHLSRGAGAKGIELIADLPDGRLAFTGIEARLAQVVVNLLDNAISLCDEGDAIRIWVRRRGDRVLLVVEDTGPGIPEGAAERIFRRFYSHRPAAQSGGNSGLGLAISRQIVEAHDGAIWAENIRPTESDLLSEPLGARFVVLLPS